MMLNVKIGKIVRSLDAFKGSKPVVNKEEMIAVRSICRDLEFNDYNSIKEYLEAKIKQNGYELMDEDDKLIMVNRINEIMDEKGIFPDEMGFDALKASFENIGCKCDYALGKKDNLMLGISMWYNEEDDLHKFVEVMVLY
ncbi:DUF2120 family protein [Methanococcus voltae]|uniref:Uncharacterized protein n=1 Tax=Methanococcus voltae (strain ATCC BAA-1334 / A3) TaxID=456320 RepID=D7DUD8_METV3|nr:DUF2120 family protein [Methanococcus voltae]MCS3900548.1 hypothetical protein [Methanococcus voltae]